MRQGEFLDASSFDDAIVPRRFDDWSRLARANPRAESR